ncbi:Variant SH3 domain containing protein [Histomonas meleagridis]|uniref:Variant SH3 domain containing protein n=1 Tax=Histomonas meleagridis TaxID=135588 RepID=UPI0035596A17|nr:Variant SH3 domain containing protein [Histomonas meleagridis]KAH0796680.1 Variant SH3 domain containing protein [Histomonas meleagridis]
MGESNPEDFIEFSQHVDHVLTESEKGIDILHTYLIKRRELEESFANELSKFLQNPVQSATSPTTLVYDEIEVILNHHKDVANELKTQFIPPIQSFQQYIRRSKTNLTKSLEASIDSIKKFQKKLFISRSQFEKAQIESLHFSTTKTDKAKRVERNLKKELDDIEKEKIQYYQKLRNVEFPNFFADMTDIDFSVRTTIKNSILNLTHYEKSSHENLLQSLLAVNISADRYEPSLETQIISKSFGIPTPRKRLFAIAKSNFDGEDVNDLSFSRGDFIEVLKQHPSGWWEGECFGRRGMFPMNFVDLLTDIESGAISINEVFEVDKKFTPGHPNEIELEFGDVVFVSTFKEGWCEGKNIGTGQKGKFPSSVVKNIKHLQI